MENGKKSIILLVAFILGIVGLVLWGIFIFTPLAARTDGSGNDSLFTVYMQIGTIGIDQLIKNLGSAVEGAGGLGYFLLVFFYIPVAFISLIPAVILNILGWLKNDAKKILIAAILYIFSLTIPSAVLCFIGFRKLKKQNVI